MRLERDRFHMEAAGSLTPELEGAPSSGLHPYRTKEKEGRFHDEARKKAEKGAVPARNEEER